jgi:L-glyceraldehyde 3-phosphate reductase
MSWQPAERRYDGMVYNRCGRSGLKLPAIALGLWHNFGGASALEDARAMIRRGFDLGITHFDLANNYGPPPGSAEETFGRVLATDLRGHRDELVVSTKAGYDMWPGPYGDGGSRKYLLASLDQSLRRMGLDHVDVFYSHRPDPETPLEETMGALDRAVSSGKALYAGISSYPAERAAQAVSILRALGTPCVVHQPSYSVINRWVEGGLLELLEREGIGCIAFSPLAQGMLSDRYLAGIPPDSRVARGGALRREFLSEDTLAPVRGLDAIARRRGQSLAQMALAWVLKDSRVTSAIVGASRPAQIEDSVRALGNREFAAAELKEIDRLALDGGVDLWTRARRA